MGRTRRKHAVRTVVAWRPGRKFRTVGAVEDPNYVQVGKAFNIRESSLEFGADLEHAFSVVLGAEALWDVDSLGKGASDEADWL